MDDNIKRDWERCVSFHGHICPGLALGFRATQIGLNYLKSLDNGLVISTDIVSIVQNDACGADAVQVLTGCTLGKGNLHFIDNGKMVFTFVRRQEGQGIRVALKYGSLENPKHQLLRKKVVDKTALPDEVEEFRKLHKQIAFQLLEAKPEEYFNWKEVQISLPNGPKLNPTLQCTYCGEGVMEQRARLKDGHIVCPECSERYESRLLALNK